MPPHLHPRSRLTTSLFGTTLLVSFLVVALPHIFPCPAPRTEFADVEITEDGRKRRRRRPITTVSGTTMAEGSASKSLEEKREAFNEGMALKRKAHECPVPKPGGIIGDVLGFTKDNREPAPPRTRVETVKRSGLDR